LKKKNFLNSNHSEKQKHIINKLIWINKKNLKNKIILFNFLKKLSGFFTTLIGQIRLILNATSGDSNGAVCKKKVGA